jgi:hypothetical protein
VTDKEKLVALLQEWDVPFAEELDQGEQVISVGTDTYTLKAISPKVIGYPGFYTAWTFDAEGKFVNVGAWE